MKTGASAVSLLPELGPALRYLRESRKVKQAELAQRITMGKSQISQYENGRRAPNFESLLRILAALDCDFHDFHNALQVAAGRFQQVCPRWTEQGEGAAAEKLAQGLSILLKASQRSS